METDNILKSIYYDTINPNSFSSAQKLYSEAKKHLPNLKYVDVTDWLSK